ncbi:MAG: tRNA pseudouridine(38-40) synthase TruA [Bacteroidia bacterium]|nr:tRNA pseudouridine(38-40) synthase TruA [Bacteroidia bacterium]MDW8235975.1 tRNA pseudouridine(38-40) synthase TruA [Bacteroidia bacterium]
MSRYVIHIAYDGTRYAGWQRQPNAETVAGTLEKVLSQLIGESIQLTGAGRTDAGVHARMQIAHWDTEKPLPSPFLHRVNALLPGAIRVVNLYRAAPTFHARHSAIARTYRYYLTLYPNPFWRMWSWWLSPPLQEELLLQATQAIRFCTNFAAFAKELDTQREPVCHIHTAQWVKVREGIYFFEITANRFLRAMVRALVGAQVRLAQGKLSWEKFLSALERGDRSWGMHLAPPQGLFLWCIQYPPDFVYLLERYGFFSAPTGDCSAPTASPEPPSDTVGAAFGSAE